MNVDWDNKPPVCYFHPFGPQAKVVYTLFAWPSMWARVWFFVFFGWRFKEMGK